MLQNLKNIIKFLEILQRNIDTMYLLVLFLLGPGLPLDLLLLDLLELLRRGLLGHLQHVAERGANHHHLRPFHHTQLPQTHLILRQTYADQCSKYEQFRPTQISVPNMNSSDLCRSVFQI
jgi:hypothetical protein